MRRVNCHLIPFPRGKGLGVRFLAIATLPDSALRAFFPHLLVAVALVEQGPLVGAFDDAPFDRMDLAPHDRVDFVALLVELRDDFTRLAKRERKVRDLGQALVAQFCQRFARQEQDSCLGKFHVNLLYQTGCRENLSFCRRRIAAIALRMRRSRAGSFFSRPGAGGSSCAAGSRRGGYRGGPPPRPSCRPRRQSALQSRNSPTSARPRTRPGPSLRPWA